jgi:cytochrome P450
MARLDGRINGLVSELVDSRVQKKQIMSSYGDDLLGRMLAAAADGDDDTALEFNFASVFNNAKLFLFAGQDTVAHTINFALMKMMMQFYFYFFRR